MRLDIRTKLFGGFGIAIILLLIVAVVAYISLSSVAGKTQEVENAAVLDDASMSMQIALLQGMDIEA